MLAWLRRCISAPPQSRTWVTADISTVDHDRTVRYQVMSHWPPPPYLGGQAGRNRYDRVTAYHIGISGVRLRNI